MNILHRLVIVCFAAGCASGAAADARIANSSADAHPSLYSFSDLYRLTVNGAAPGSIGTLPAANEAQQVRVATAQPAPSEVRFTITPVPGPGRWPLLFAGLVLAAWVAHRRLSRSL